MNKISQKIVSYSVVKDDKQPEPSKITNPERPPVLSGKTYKIAKSPLSESALYVTLNDCEGKPFEIFLNSKDTRNYQWIIALTRVISSVFRKGGDCTFLIEELKSIYDPNGGYFKKGKYVPSLVAEIGEVLEQHFISLGLYEKDESLVLMAQAMIKEKTESSKNATKSQTNAQTCVKCGEMALVRMDGCLTCTACGYSHCG